MDLSQQLAILRPRLLLIILVTVIAGVLSFGLASLIPKTYEAHATLLVGQVYDTSQPSQPPRLNYDAFLASEQLATTFAQLADTRPVLSAVAAKLKLSDDPTALRERVDAVASPGSLFIAISARAADADSAANLANQVAAELLAEAPGILAGSDVAKADGIVTLVDPAVAAEAVKSPKVTLYAALGALTALIVAVATIFVLAYRETPPFRRAPAARRVGTPEPQPVAEPSAPAHLVGPVPEPRPSPAAQARPFVAPEPPPGPILLTEVRRPAPVISAPPVPAVETRPAAAPPARPAARPSEGPMLQRLLASAPATIAAKPSAPPSVARSEPALRSSAPVKATETAKPVVEVRPAVVVKGAGPIKPAARVKPAADIKRPAPSKAAVVVAAAPVAQGKAARLATPAPARPAAPPKPAAPAAPVKAEKPVKAAKLAAPALPAKPAEPAVRARRSTARRSPGD